MDPRASCIGSTDVGPIVALYRPELATLAKYQTAADVWMRLVHNIWQPKRNVMARGLTEEPRLRQLYRDTIGPVSDAPEATYHPRLPFSRATPDGYVGDDGLAEYKTTTVWARKSWGTPGTDEVPDTYSVQTQWAMECTARRWCHLLVAFGVDIPADPAVEGSVPGFAVEETAIYQLERDDELCAALVESVERFWREHVALKTPPAVEPQHNRRQWKALLKGLRVDGKAPPVEAHANQAGANEVQS